MTPDELDERSEGMRLDDPIARLVRAARPSAPVGLADRVLAASVAASPTPAQLPPPRDPQWQSPR
jgi:hypothetical protein